MEIRWPVFVAIAAASLVVLLGVAGALYWKRRKRLSRSDEIIEHPERLDEMLDSTDDA